MRKWLPIGPSGVRKGQASGNPLVSGRVTGIAPLGGGNTVYVCTANGGVWKTTDAGRTWAPLTDAFVPGATPTGVDSEACGAIAVAPGAGTGGKDLVYVGTGEAFIAGDRYFGIGPLVSDDGGTSWRTEQANPSLVGSGFWRIVIDPANVQHAFAATRAGIYVREPSGKSFVWNRVSLPPGAATYLTPNWDKYCTGIAVAQDVSGTHVFAALGAFSHVDPHGTRIVDFPGGVFHWDSATAVWTRAGAGWNPTNPWITVLAMQPNNPHVVYALVSNIDRRVAGVFRLDTSGTNGLNTPWVALSHVPADLFGSLTPPPGETRPLPGQGDYDIVVAVDPVDVNRIYLGGARSDVGAALFRCQVTLGSSSNRLTPVNIGARVHADIHAIEFQPGAQRTLWVGCDGGVFVTYNALGDETDSGGHPIPTAFASRNLGLSTLQFERLGLHPREDGVLFGGLQDNGTLRYTSEELWLEVGDGDGGEALVNWANPRTILRGITEKNMAIAHDGAQSLSSWSDVNVLLEDGERVMGYPPIVGLPLNLVNSSTAGLLAFGSERVWISTTFGQSWPASIPSGRRATDAIEGSSISADRRMITALAWASATKLYAGTHNGSVARYDRASATSSTWTRRIVNSPPATAPSGSAISTTVPPNPITSIAVDPADSTGNSIYITIGGQLSSPYMGRARVWRGTDTGAGHYTWEMRSGPNNLADPTPPALDFRLMDLHHSVIIVDPAHPERLYVGADIGVWRSHTNGHKWYPYTYGIPEAAVVDLKLHPDPKKRILWAATHGRGVFEMPADATWEDSSDPILRYLVRDTPLDVGRGTLTPGAVDPTRSSGAQVAFGHSPDIRIDTPARDGTYSTLSEDISVAQFFEALDGQMRAFRPHTGAPVDNRVFVQIHQRGTALPLGSGVQVMLLLAPGTTPPALPAGYTTNVQNGTTVTGGGWTTVGTTTVNNVWALTPRIAHFRLSSSSLAGHNDWCLLVLLHAPAGAPDNAFTSTDTDVQAMCAQSSLATWSTFSVVETTRATSHREPGFLAMILETIGLGSVAGPGNDNLPADVIDH